MEDSIYESISFRKEQEKVKERLSFQMQNMQKNYSVEDSILIKNLDYSIISQTSRLQQNQCANHQQNQQQTRINSINLLYQHDQNPKDIQFLDNNDILLMSPFQFSSVISKDMTPSDQIAGKIDQNSQQSRQSQYSLQPIQFDDSTKKQFFTPNNKNNMKPDQNNNFLSEIYQPNDFQNIQQNQEGASKTQVVSFNYSKKQQLKTQFVLNKFADVKKFVNKLKEKSRRLLFKSISDFQFDIINDVSSDLDFYLKRKCINQTKRTIGISFLTCLNNQIFGKSFQEFLDGKYLFSLDTLLMQMWDIFAMLFTIALIIIIPMMHLLVFQEMNFLIIFHDHIIAWVLIIDTMLSLNTEIYENGVNIRDRRQIFKQNFNNLMQDFLILIIYNFSTSSYKSKMPFLQNLDYVVFLKYLSIPQKVSEFENKLQISDSAKNWMKLIKLEILVIALAHIACCIFLKIGLENIQKGEMSWVIKAGFSTESLWDLYLQSLYYMIITICTIGYGDISPYQLNEKLYIAFLSILATNVTAYAFSQISEIVKFESSKNQKFNDFMTDVNNQMKKIGLGMSLQVKVRKHFEFVYYQDEYKQQISESIVDKLPNSLKNEVLIDIYQEKINSIKMFKEFSSDCLKNILLSFKQKQLFPDEILLNQYENSQSLYFLISGNLEINFQIRETKSGKTYEKSKQKIQKSEAFGYEGFLLGKCSQYTLKSIGPSLVSYIDRNLFLQILKQYPQDYEKFIFMRDSAIFGQKNEFFKFQKCTSCGKFSHQIFDCPYLSLNLTYKPSKEKNSRLQQFQRKMERKRNSLNNLIYIQEKAMAAQANNDESAIIDAYNICLKPISVNDEKEIQSEFSSQSLNNSKNNDKAQSSPQIAEKQTIPFQSLSQKLPYLTNLQNKEQEQLVNEVSIKIDESGQSDQTQLKANENTLVNDQDKEKLSEFYQKSKETDIFNEESCGYRNSNRSILLTEEVYKDKLSNQDKLNQEKSNGIFNLGSSTIDKQYSSQQSGGQFKIQKINTLLIESSQNYFEEPEIYLLKQAFQKRKMRSLQQFNNFQRSLSDKVYDTKKSFNFNQSKQNISLLDILMSLRDSKLRSQSTQLKNIQNKEYLNSLIEQLALIHKNRSENEIIDSHQYQNQQIFKESTKQAEDFNQQIENFTEFSIRQKIGLQDLDMLVVRKQFMLQQQQNKIQNFIQVPDNEIDIDRMQNFKYYYANYNHKFVLNRYKNYQDKKQVLSHIKLKKLKKQKIKQQHKNSSKSDI
ncbi:cyclic nucleotide-binding domain protein (macronuclear) [Tetrahymena thermophila SB210]|uniref:Cyclic nucleotide-binding domain protein n=1 Tax=Tetrahymena thermophila (strain SB210) TaxID=312017 RepID=Q22U37_TETTS|nr:cyclic nucleotide-binding domain protein [Tetrahymena thermophila SB210]EAR88850.2 cyclic nucleotide-binding domain protein [Tetrahymena thermophila SB210]|eukprot:XP_001009095.2 cyclic nucleotide-binding domain protein [Tetrahymena thermophila SB210]